MGQAPRIIEELRQTSEQVREADRQWVLDNGVLAPEVEPKVDPDEAPEVRPEPLRVARYTYD